MKVNIGGNRIGSGSKLSVDLKTYERSTHDLGYLWRSTMAAGTLVPFMNELALPGDTFDINLNAEVKTLPTLGPLFGSYKLQLDIFECPIRLYNAQLHNNRLGIGMQMNTVKFPTLTLTSYNLNPGPNSYQINPSALLAYLGIMGLGTSSAGSAVRTFNAMPMLAYWDIYKNYYANKQETNAYYVHTPVIALNNNVGSTGVVTGPASQGGGQLGYNAPVTNVTTGEYMQITYTGTFTLNQSIVNQIRLFDISGNSYQPNQIYTSYYYTNNGGVNPSVTFTNPQLNLTLNYWRFQNQQDPSQTTPQLTAFPLSNIDYMRDSILGASGASAYSINNSIYTPYTDIFQNNGTNFSAMQASQDMLAVKTYQSDLYNNWMQTAWQTQIASQTAVSTAGNSFTIDSLNLAKKVYNLLNRIAISGGSYVDWINTVYTADTMAQPEIPSYHGGLSKEVLFQEVVSMASTQNINTQNNEQPLGTLAGKGVLGKKHKGGDVIIKVKEPAYIIGIVSLTPRIDYSQGNKWHIDLKTPDDFHKPALDEIGFQNLITDQMAYWDTQVTSGGVVTYNYAGLQPAWINYMTNVNRTYGNFAIVNNQMYMTLNRRYGMSGGRISDLTTYIDPSHYNFIFAQTSLDAQNFWTQIAVNITARRKMSAKIMPSL